MKQYEQQLDTIMRYIAAEKKEDRERARMDLQQMMAQRAPARPKDAETLIRDILLELGMPDHLKGHAYLVCALLAVIRVPGTMDNITTRLYPHVAATFGSTPTRVERAMRHAIEVCWDRGDLDVIMGYFGNTVSSFKGRPTNAEFLARIANTVRSRLREAA